MANETILACLTNITKCALLNVLNYTRTKTYQNSCLQKALRIKRDGYVNKYTNPRNAETTTPEYITVIQDLKQQAKKNLRSDYKKKTAKKH